MNKLSIIIDHYLDITNQEPDNYKRHLRAAKQLLELCDGDHVEACQILDKTKKWVEGFGGEDWKIETCIKYYADHLIKCN